MNVRERSLLICAVLTLIAATAQAQNAPPPAPVESGRTKLDGQELRAEKNPAPEQAQPQGATGPTDTSSGGAPASSPQGDTPPGMQPVPLESPSQSPKGVGGGRS